MSETKEDSTFLDATLAGENPGESDPLETQGQEGKDIFFAGLRMFADPEKVVPADRKLDPGLNPEEKFSALDESNYDTKSFTPDDFYPYCVVFGYRKDKPRKEVSMKEFEKIVEGRKQYLLPPIPELGCENKDRKPDEHPFTIGPDESGNVPKTIAEYVQGDSTLTMEDFKKYWFTDVGNCVGPGGVPCYYDSCGCLSSEFIKKVNENQEKNMNAIRRWEVLHLEQVTQAKLRLSRERGYRITKHYSVIDCAKTGVTTINSIKPILKAVVGDVSYIYPETVQQIFMVNTSWLFKAAWAIISLFVHPETAKKIQMKGSNWRESLQKKGFGPPPPNFG